MLPILIVWVFPLFPPKPDSSIAELMVCQKIQQHMFRCFPFLLIGQRQFIQLYTIIMWQYAVLLCSCMCIGVQLHRNLILKPQHLPTAFSSSDSLVSIQAADIKGATFSFVATGTTLLCIAILEVSSMLHQLTPWSSSRQLTEALALLFCSQQ